MALSSTNQGSDQVYGAQGKPIQGNWGPPIIASRDPTSADINYKVGREWINKVTPSIWFLGSKASSTAVWIAAGSGTVGGVVTITGTSGGPISPTAGNINLLGTANQMSFAGSGSTLTGSLSATLVAPGSVTVTSGFSVLAGTSSILGTVNINNSGAGVTTIGTGGTGAVNIGNATGNTAVTGSLTASTSLTATLGNVTLTNGNLVLVAAGNKINHTSVAATTTAGANSIGTVTLVGGTATISTSAVGASSLIQLTRMGIGATGAAALGVLSVGTVTAGVSFVINSVQPATATSLQASDVSVVLWEIMN